MFPTNWWRAIQMPFLKEPSSRTLMVFEPLLIMWPWIAVWNTTLLQCHCNPEEVLPCLPNAKADEAQPSYLDAFLCLTEQLNWLKVPQLLS